MSTAAELQTLLRFLTQDAKVPLASAMGKVKELQKESLTDLAAISKSDVPSLQKIFVDEKVAKQVLSAAKRVSKKRTISDAGSIPSPRQTKKPVREEEPSPASIEASLLLPSTDADEAELSRTVLLTNRAPVVLAFAVTLLKYTVPEQPLSSRLSLAQAVVSLNSRSKAVSLGLEGGKSAEDEGYGQGQPIVKIMGREVRVLKRWGYEWKKTPSETTELPEDSQTTIQAEETQNDTIGIDYSQTPALWGLDLEALRKSNSSLTAGANSVGSGLPIYTAQSARTYLLRSFASQETKSSDGSPPKRKSSAVLTAEKEHNLGLLLQALDLLFLSWVDTLGKDDLDRRAWSWYVHVRPDVQTGVSGWGEKSQLRLADILKLRRKP